MIYISYFFSPFSTRSRIQTRTVGHCHLAPQKVIARRRISWNGDIDKSDAYMTFEPNLSRMKNVITCQRIS